MARHPQTTSQVLMVRPANFQYNEETGGDNMFQTSKTDLSGDDIRKIAQIEFDNAVEELRSKGIDVIVYNDTDSPIKPDAIFPNNWLSMHNDGTIITYPMYAENRRLERNDSVIEKIGEKFEINKRYSFEQYEEENLFLEGTGSMVLDHENKIAYACLSERTDIEILDKFSLLRGYEKVAFTALDSNGVRVYHTNVMMCIGKDFAVICLEIIRDPEEKAFVVESLEKHGKQIIEITEEQMNAFAGNMLQLENAEGETYLFMSNQARRSLTDAQIDLILSKTRISTVGIDTIEKFGGGSIRCMIAEIFLPEK